MINKAALGLLFVAGFLFGANQQAPDPEPTKPPLDVARVESAFKWSERIEFGNGTFVDCFTSGGEFSCDWIAKLRRERE